MNFVSCVFYVIYQETVMSCDNSFVSLFGYQTTDEVTGAQIKRFLPSLKLPSHGGALTQVCHLITISYNNKVQHELFIQAQILQVA